MGGISVCVFIVVIKNSSPPGLRVDGGSLQPARHQFIPINYTVLYQRNNTGRAKRLLQPRAAG